MNVYWMSFSLAFIALGLWFFSSRPAISRIWQLVFFTSVLAYTASLFFQDAPAVYRLQALARDFLFLGCFGGLFALLSGKRNWFWVGMGTALIALVLYVREMQGNTFPYLAPITLDKHGELLVELRPGTSPQALADLQNRFGLRISRAFYPRNEEITALDEYYVADVPEQQRRNLVKIIRSLQRNHAVEWVEENEVIQVDPLLKDVPNAPDDDAARYGLNDPGVANLWAFRQMAMDKLYGLLESRKIKPVKKALVAILDTGVDARHEDLRENYTSLKTEFDNDPKGHGTHCAGIAAAVSNNGLGIASFSRDNAFYSVASVKVLGAGGMGTQKMIIDGMLYAVDRGADVLSMSLGGPGRPAAQRAYAKAVAYAVSKGAIVVAAAGNSNRNARDFSPANVKGVLCVSAVDERMDKAPFSNYVRDVEMAVAAPGVDIYSTIPGDEYVRYSGTSMAAPQVAGLVAMMKSLKPDLKPEEAFEILKKSGKDTKDSPMTGKFIQPAEALRLVIGR